MTLPNMLASKPTYTPSNCRPAYQLNWSLSVFWKEPPLHLPTGWLDRLRDVTEPDGVRVLQHRFRETDISQFLVSTKPHVSPLEMVRSVKGRMQHLIGDLIPRAFRRNYAFRSIGTATREAVEEYIVSQVGHHPMADPRIQETLKRFQIHCREADLSAPRRTAHGQYWYNLHIVLANESRWREVCAERLQTIHDTILNITEKRGHVLSRVAILPDHVHLAVGCSPEKSPMDVALCYMNNLSWALGMSVVFQYSYYVGTFGEYDRAVVPEGSGE